jgi:hypothetical protein
MRDIRNSTISVQFILRIAHVKDRYLTYNKNTLCQFLSFRACGNCPDNITACFQPQCVLANGYERGILTVNRRLPGPGIQVCILRHWTAVSDSLHAPIVLPLGRKPRHSIGKWMAPEFI